MFNIHARSIPYIFLDGSSFCSLPGGLSFLVRAFSFPTDLNERRLNVSYPATSTMFED